MLKQSQIAIKVPKCFLSISLSISLWTNSFTHWHQFVDGTLSSTALATSQLLVLTYHSSSSLSPLFWTDNHTRLSFLVKSPHNSLKCFLTFVFWYHCPIPWLEHSPSSPCQLTLGNETWKEARAWEELVIRSWSLRECSEVI